MAKSKWLNGYTRVVSTVSTVSALIAVLITVVVAHTTALNQIESNTDKLTGQARQLNRIELVVVKIAQKADIDVSALFNE